VPDLRPRRMLDESRNKHATRHFKETGHPIIQSYEPGEAWGWCFVDRAFFDQLPLTY
jgi:Zn-finger in ubiquitin-hydrolases and other protein.